MRRAAIILTLSVSFVLLAAWSVLRSGTVQMGEPLWMPLPGIASAPSLDPLDSKQICEHATRLKAQFNPATVHTTILGYVVERDGAIDNIVIAGTSGSKALDQAVVACVATLRFQPLKPGRAMTVGWK